jgi:site-specific DNA-methyltransferase (cytosine-N4-specific)
MIQIIKGDCRKILGSLRSASVDCCITSPPYFNVRDYGVKAQIGLELIPREYADQIVSVFREVRRVLRNDGTLWLNLGDTMNNRKRIRSSSHQPSLNEYKEPSWAEATKKGLTRLSVSDGDLKEKDMFGMPWAIAFALRADGWFLRQEIIWRKNFGKPEPSVDRLPNRHEQIFLLSKSKNYYFNRSALPSYANTTVWDISPTGRSDHGASFSENIAEACILAGCKKNGTVLDPFSGLGTTGVVAQRLKRNAVLIEIKTAYVKATRQRLKDA